MLTIYQKSVYLDLLNATMIARSLGRSFPLHNRKRKIRQYKKLVFMELEYLCTKMEDGTLRTTDIRQSIERISSSVGVSFGQAQKAINVLVKYHFALYHLNSDTGIQLDCPLDSVILKDLGERISLARLDYDRYIKIQNRILELSERRVDFDQRWDEQHLWDEELL